MKVTRVRPLGIGVGYTCLTILLQLSPAVRRFFAAGTGADFTNCRFIDNKTYFAFVLLSAYLFFVDVIGI